MERARLTGGQHRPTEWDQPDLHEPVLSLTSVQQDTTTRVTVAGEVDMSNAHLLVDVVALASSSSPSLIVLDLSEVCFFGAHGISALLQVRDLVAAAGHRLVISAPSPFVLRVFAATGMVRHLRLDLGPDTTGHGSAPYVGRSGGAPVPRQANPTPSPVSPPDRR